MSQYIEKISSYIQKELNLSEEKREVIAYGMDTFVSTILGILGIFVFGYLFGLLVPALLIAMSALITRVFTGGAHCGSMARCTVVTIVTFIVLAYISKTLLIPSFILILALFILGVAIIMKYAPVEVKEKPLSASHQKQLRRGAFRLLLVIGIVVLLSQYVLDPGTVLFIIVGFLWQCFSITPIGFKIINKIDDLLKNSMEGGKIHEKS